MLVRRTAPILCAVFMLLDSGTALAGGRFSPSASRRSRPAVRHCLRLGLAYWFNERGGKHDRPGVDRRPRTGSTRSCSTSSDGKQRAAGDLRRTRREPLVHREGRKQDRRRSPRRARSAPSRSTRSCHPRSQPQEICNGPDGALWFTEPGINKDRPDHDGRVVTEYPLPTASSSPLRIYAGSGRKALGHLEGREQGRERDDDGNGDGVHDPHGGERPARHHARERQQHVVHRERREQDRRRSRRRAPSRNTRCLRPAGRRRVS